MTTAKIIRHRHKTCKYINDDLKSVDEESHWKVVFSDPAEMNKYKQIIMDHGGAYNFVKDEGKQLGVFPEKFEEILGDDICWCDVSTYILLHMMGYEFNSIIASPYKGEIYVKQETKPVSDMELKYRYPELFKQLNKNKPTNGSNEAESPTTNS